MLLDAINFLFTYWWVFTIVIGLLMIAVIISSIITDRNEQRRYKNPLAVVNSTVQSQQENTVSAVKSIATGNTAIDTPTKTKTKKASNVFVVSYDQDLHLWVVKKENGKNALLKTALKVDATKFAKEKATAVGGTVVAKTKNSK